MNSQLLRDQLVRELTELFKDRRYPSPRGPVPLQIFKQLTPIKEVGSIEDIIPYIIVRINGGKVETVHDPHLVNVTFLAGAFDEDENNKGFDAVEEIIHEIALHFTQNPLFGEGRFRFDYPINWVNQDEESYPYFFGALTCDFQIMPPIYTKESDFV